MKRVTLLGGVGAGVALTLAWLFDEQVFQLPAPFSVAEVIVVGSVAYLLTLTALARRGHDGKGVALRVLLAWLLLCPLVVGALAELYLLLEPIPPDLAAAIEAAGQSKAGLSVHKVSQAMVRALIGVLGAGWLLVRALLRPLPQRGAPG